jgi:predicted FMN-binding regulatory protein PaiB
MYVPKHFEAASAAAIRSLIDRYAFGVLISSTGGRIDVSQVPFLRVGEDRLRSNNRYGYGTASVRIRQTDRDSCRG